MEKLPLGKTRLASYAAALWFLKEEARKRNGTPRTVRDNFL